MIFIKIYDDSEESTHDDDVRRGRVLMAILTTFSFGIALLGITAGDELYGIKPLLAFIIFVIAGLVYIGLSFYIQRIKKYPFIYTNISMLVFGMSLYITGLAIKSGLIVLLISMLIFIIYIIAILKYNVDEPDLT